MGNTSNCCLQMRSKYRTQVLSMQRTTRNRGLQMEIIMGRRRKIDVSQGHKDHSTCEYSGVEIPSRPSGLDEKLSDILVLLFQAGMVIGPVLCLFSIAYLFEGSPVAALISGTIGVIMVSCYARK